MQKLRFGLQAGALGGRATGAPAGVAATSRSSADEWRTREDAQQGRGPQSVQDVLRGPAPRPSAAPGALWPRRSGPGGRASLQPSVPRAAGCSRAAHGARARALGVAQLPVSHHVSPPLSPADQPPGPGGKTAHAPGAAARVTSVSTGNLCAEVGAWPLGRPPPAMLTAPTHAALPPRVSVVRRSRVSNVLVFNVKVRCMSFKFISLGQRRSLLFSDGTKLWLLTQLSDLCAVF